MKVEHPWSTSAEQRADNLLNGCRVYSQEVRAVAKLYQLLEDVVFDLDKCGHLHTHTEQDIRDALKEKP